ncbi:MAG TPA: SH3 domain-containing protein [Verrucomicrobiae bacterium]|nr:SH3 domain-containing protein [Verrucomicrobiae bacterium]
MKTNCWLILGAMLTSGAMAQNNTNALPEIPAPVTSPAAETAPSTPPPAAQPAARAVKHRARPGAEHRRPALHEPTVTLTPGPAEVIASHLAVRGQAGLRGEVIAHLNQGDTVTVLDQINLAKHAPGEPAQWARIVYPAPHVWVFGKYIDPTSKTVTARKLNLRAGPGENYSVVGLLEQGATVNEVQTKGNWMEIDAPSNAYAFVAAMYLKQAPAPAVAATPPPPPPPPVTPPAPPPVPETQPVVTAPPTPPAVETTPASATVTLQTESNPGPRMATREGVVRHVGSLIAPTAYELYDPATDQNIDFLYTTSTNLDFGRYVGMRIIASGEEGLAKRWHDIPVLTVDSIQVIDSNAVPRKIYYSPREQKLHSR